MGACEGRVHGVQVCPAVFVLTLSDRFPYNCSLPSSLLYFYASRLSMYPVVMLYQD